MGVSRLSRSCRGCHMAGTLQRLNISECAASFLREDASTRAPLKGDSTEGLTVPGLARTMRSCSELLGAMETGFGRTPPQKVSQQPEEPPSVCGLSSPRGGAFASPSSCSSVSGLSFVSSVSGLSSDAVPSHLNTPRASAAPSPPQSPRARTPRGSRMVGADWAPTPRLRARSSG